LLVKPSNNEDNKNALLSIFLIILSPKMIIDAILTFKQLDHSYS